MPKRYFITGIGTDVGKTICAAILTQKYGFHYWKPIQAGLEPQTDTQRVKELVTRTDIVYHPERYVLRMPASPHLSAEQEKIALKLSDFHLPASENLLIEGAGGLLVPLNYQGDTIADLADKLDAEIILVSRHYLGSINHSLMSIEVARNRGLAIAGIVFNGEEHPSTERVILATGVKFLGRINQGKTIDADFIQAQGENMVLD